MNKEKIACWALIACVAFVVPAWSVESGLGLVPWPQSLTLTGGDMALSDSSQIVFEDPSLSVLAQVLVQEIKATTCLQLTAKQGRPSAGDIFLAKTYRYWIKAWNRWGWSDMSTAASGQTGRNNDLTVAYEPFEYANGMDIDQQNGGGGFGAAWDIQQPNGSVTVTSEGLSYAIIPSLQSVAMGSGHTTITPLNRIRYSESSLLDIANLLQKELILVHGLDLKVRSGGAPSAGDIVLKLNSTLPKSEQYQLTTNGFVTLESGSVDGMYAGTVSILQAIHGTGQAKGIKNMTVIDEPDKPIRGVMVDIKNKWHSVDDIKEIIRLCRFYKINTLSLHTGEAQWIAAVMDQTDTFSAETRLKNRLYTKGEMEDIIAFARGQGVSMLPHNETCRGFEAMQKAVSHDFDSADEFANFIDEYDGQGVYAGDYNDTRYWAFIYEVTRRAIDQFKAGYASGVLPYYHIGPVQGEGGMSREDAVRIIGAIRAKDAQVKTMFWNGIDGKVQDALSALKPHIVIAYYQQWGGSQITEYLDNGWTVLNAAWSPLYVVGTGVARTQKQVHNDWNLYRTGTDGFRGSGFEYEAIRWISFENASTNNLMIGGMLCTWEVPADVHMDRLRLRVPAFVEHAWHHKPWPYPPDDYTDLARRYVSTDDGLTRFLMRAQVPSNPENLCATDQVFEDRVMVNWTASSNNPTGYTVYRSMADDSSTATRIASVSPCEYADTDVVKGITYTYWVDAHNTFGHTDLSDADSGTPGTTNPPAFAYEPFDYPTASAITGQQGGAGWFSAWHQTSANGTCEINDDGLTYGSLPVSGRSIRLNASTGKPSILFNRSLAGKMGLAGMSTWMSYLLKCHVQGNGHLFVGFNKINLGKRWGSQIAIENHGTPVNVANGRTYFIVCQVVNRAGHDEAYVWINPSLDRPPLKADAALKVTTIDMTEANGVIVNNQGYGQGSYDIDEIRVGCTWQQVTGVLEHNEQ